MRSAQPQAMRRTCVIDYVTCVHVTMLRSHLTLTLSTESHVSSDLGLYIEVDVDLTNECKYSKSHSYIDVKIVGRCR